MKLLPVLLFVGLTAAVPVVQSQETQKKPTDPAFEGCIAAAQAEGAFLLRNAHAAGGTIAGTGLQFRLLPDKGVELKPHVGHVVRVTGPMEGTVPASGKTVPEPELPLIRVKTVTMVSSECLQP
jgi:hypothetical protein